MAHDDALMPISSRLTQSLYEELELLAQRNDRSIAAEVRLAIIERLEQANAEAPLRLAGVEGGKK